MKKTFVLTLFILLFSQVYSCKQRNNSTLFDTQNQHQLESIQNENYTISKTYQSKQIVQPVTFTQNKVLTQVNQAQVNTYFATRRKDNVNVLRFDFYLHDATLNGPNKKLESFEIEEKDYKNLKTNNEALKAELTPIEYIEKDGHIQFKKIIIQYIKENKKLILSHTTEVYTNHASLSDEKFEKIVQTSSLQTKTTKHLELTYDKNILLDFGNTNLNISASVNIFDGSNLISTADYKISR